MTAYLISLTYNGTHFSGWQYQINTPNTIEEILGKSIRSFIGDNQIKISGASRTDAGVHAQGQLVKFQYHEKIPLDKLLKGINANLPFDIRVTKIEYCEESFNFNDQIKSKIYHYYFTSGKIANGLLAQTVNYHSEQLDIALMKKACELIVGEHDFSLFFIPGGRNPSPIRKIINCSLEKTSFAPWEDEIYYLKIESNGFLKYMVRFIMGTLFQIGLHHISLEELKQLLHAERLHLKLKKAPASGLHLVKINCF